MGIPIKKYIDISTAVLNREGSSFDQNLIVFVSTTPKSGWEHVEAFERGDVLTISSVAEAKDGWAESSNIYKIAAKYFGTTVNGRSPEKMYVVNSTTTFDDLVDKFTGFGSCMKEDVSLDDTIAEANKSLGRRHTFICGGSSIESDSEDIKGTAGTHAILLDGSKVEEAACIAAWIATRNYYGPNTLGTVDYTEFPNMTPTVTTGTRKDGLDGKNINYIGKVQIRGEERSFYQTGVNLDGEDLGVYCDSCWIQNEIETGWINLALGATKIPFNDFGAMRVRSMIIDVAESALYNGAILVDKPLNDTQIQEINFFAGTEDAAPSVQTNGYYVATRLLPEKVGGKFVCEYILIYAKGDHIQKIEGSHLLA